MEDLIQDECKVALEKGREEGVNLFEQVLIRLKRGDTRDDVMRELSVSEETIQKAEAFLA
jgi:hypothetical protein